MGGIWKFPDEGSNWSCSCWPTPQPQQRGIWAAPATYSTAHSNTGSFNPLSEARDQTCVLCGDPIHHCHWMLVKFISDKPRRELPSSSILDWNPFHLTQRPKWPSASGSVAWGYLQETSGAVKVVSFYRILPWRSSSKMDIPSFLSSTTVIGVRSSRGKGLTILC